MHGKIDLVDEIDPKPDTPDFYGALPLFYAIQNNDFAMIKK